MKNTGHTIIHTLGVTIDEKYYDYEVTVSLIGEVLAVDSLMERLPEAAQKLTLGADYKKYLQEIHLYGEYLKYVIPVELNPIKENETYSFFNQPLVIDPAELLVSQESLADIKIKLAALQQEPGIQNKQDTTSLPQSAWIKSYRQLFHKYEQSTLSKEEFLAIQGLRMLFLKDINKYHTAFHYLTPLVPENADGYLKLFWELIPRLYALQSPKGDSSHLRRRLFDVIIKYEGNSTKEWLLSIFQSPEHKVYHTMALNALAVYKEPEHYQLIIDYCNENFKTNAKGSGVLQALEGILKLAPFIDHWAIELARHFIRQKSEYEISYIAYCILRKGGLSEEAIMVEVLPSFLNKTRTNALLSNMCVFAFLIKNEDLLPDAGQLLDITIHHLEQLNNKITAASLAITHFTPLILEKKCTPDLSDSLYQLTFHEVAKVRELALVWQAYLTRSEKCDFLPHKQLKSRCIELLKDANDYVITEAVKWCAYYGLKEEDNTYITKLLPFVNHKYCCLQKYSLLGINTLLKEVGFDTAVHDTYLALTKEKFGYCYDGQATVIHALQLSPLETIQDKIKGVKFNPQDRFPMIYPNESDKSEDDLRFLREVRKYAQY
ncbi:hypothetical protein [Lewinella cohaerens]|uniref:hypothetical protein n=1 Tax=Lewinella cohaerens TaxID=70995 RepID=UPI00036CD3F5|nr:hypothetical protein [Lewinella cohaerens]